MLCDCSCYREFEGQLCASAVKHLPAHISAVSHCYARSQSGHRCSGVPSDDGDLQIVATWLYLPCPDGCNLSRAEDKRERDVG
jgi:hypothetical protein